MGTWTVYGSQFMVEGTIALKPARNIDVRRFTQMAIDPVALARRLLGQRLVRIIDGERLSGIIVETEAYLGVPDPAAHTYRGHRSARNESMYLEGGHAYVYFTYGAHFCLNVVAGKKDEGVAVLIRALEPQEGINRMMTNRFGHRLKILVETGGDADAKLLRQLTSGPGKLAQALQIDRKLDGLDLRTDSRLFIEQMRKTVLPDSAVGTSQRVGLNPREHWPTGWAERALRFFIVGNQHVSRLTGGKRRLRISP